MTIPIIAAAGGVEMGLCLNCIRKAEYRSDETKAEREKFERELAIKKGYCDRCGRKWDSTGDELPKQMVCDDDHFSTSHIKFEILEHTLNLEMTFIPQLGGDNVMILHEDNVDELQNILGRYKNEIRKRRMNEQNEKSI